MQEIDGRLELDADWAQLREEREKFEAERAAFEEERAASGMEVKLFVGNLSTSTGEEQVRVIFEKYGTIKEIIMLKDKEGNSKRSCFVKFYITKEAQEAIADLNDKHKDLDSPDFLAVRFANPKAAPQSANVGGHVGTLGSGYGAPAVSGSYGASGYGFGASTVTNSGVDRYGKINSYQHPSPGAYMRYGVAHSSTVHSNPYLTSVNDGPLAREDSFGGGRGPNGANLYVNNLAGGTTSQDLQSMFAEFGTVISAKAFTTGHTAFKYGFVSFNDPSSAQAAINHLDGMDIGNAGRRLEVRLKTEKAANRGNRYTPY